jgi:uncharacterized repeat protein (TIGR01451 family)
MVHLVHSPDRGERDPQMYAVAVSASVLLCLVMCCLTGVAQAQSDTGRFLTHQSAIAESNSNGTNGFTVVSNGSGGTGGDSDASGATNVSVAGNGTIAFDAIWSVYGGCSSGRQGICRSHVFVMDPGTPGVRQITFTPSNPTDASNFSGDNNAAISPDGTMVAFVSNRQRVDDANGNPHYLNQVYVVNTDGSNLHQITFPVFGQPGSPQEGSIFGEIYSLAWSPDSKTLAFRGNQYGTFCGTFFGFPIQFEPVGVVNADGTGHAYLTCVRQGTGSGSSLDWSPDGALIAYGRTGNIGDPAIAFIDLSGGGRYTGGLTFAQIGNLCDAPQCIHFSPDSSRLAYVNASSGVGNISTINLDGAGRIDTTVSSNLGATSGGSPGGIWWAPGVVPPAVSLALAPDQVEVWPDYSQQLDPSLLDAGNNPILHAAATYNVAYTFGHSCSIHIGPYGLVMYSSGSGDGGSLSVTNAGLISNSVPFKCWIAPPCTYALSPVSEGFCPAGGSGSIGVTTDPGTNDSTCPWSATSNASWITITSSPGGSGDGPVHFAVAPNSGPARQGTLTVAGKTFAVNQGTTCGADVAITELDSPDPATVGNSLTYTITVTNNGPGTATGVTMNDSLPGGVSVVSVTPSQGSCDGTSTISCTLGTLANGAAAMVTIVVTPTQTGALSNTATVTANESDPDPNNNSATESTTVNPGSRLLSALGPAKLWVGQADATKQLKFDLRAEVFVNGTVVGSGQLANVPAGGSSFAKATLDTISLSLGSPVDVPAGAALAIRASVRASCSARGTGHAGVARLWYNGQPVDTGRPWNRDAGSRFDAAIGGTNIIYFLRQATALATVPGTSTSSVDAPVNDTEACPTRPFTPFGTWSITLP